MSDYSFRDITILHADQDVEWCKYLEGNFRLDKLKLHTLNVGQLCYNNPPEIEVAVRESYVVMLLVTSNFLTYMESKVDWFEPMLRKRDSEVTTVVAALVDIDNFPEEMGKLPYKDESRNSWTVIEIDVQGRNIKECITQVLEILDKNSSKRNERSRKVSEHRAVDFEMIPSSIQGPGEKVAILFHEEMKGTVTVNIPGVKTDIPVKVVNPYSVTFIVPDVVKDKVRVQVNVDGVKIKRVTLLNKSMMYHLTSIEFMCQSYGVVSKEELDRKLADNFNKSLCNDGCAKQVLDDVMGNSSTGSIDHNNKFPTILHWAAANGLSEFCSALLSSVGSVVACGIVNCEGRDPADLARINNHHELYSLLVDFAETKEMADTCDLYVKYCSQTTGQKRHDSQDDTYVFPSPLEGEDIYEHMMPSHTPKPALPPPPNFKPAVKPFGPRPSPPPGNSEPPKITPRKPSDQTLEDTQDSEYVVPEPVIPAGAIGSRSQSELIEIQQEVKNGNFSIEEAEMLFRSWKERYETGNAVSFKERQQSLQALREKHVKTMDALKNVKSKNKTKLKKCIEHPEEDDILSPEISEPFSLRSTTIKEVQRGSNASSTSSLMRISKDSGRESADIRGSITSTSSDESELYDDGSRLQQTIEQRTHTFPRPSQSFFRGPRMHRRHSSDTPSHAVNRSNDEIYSTVRQIAYYSHSTKQTRKKDSQ